MVLQKRMILYKKYWDAMKIDFTKAYDSISCNFIHQVLIEMEFPPLWIQVIMQCVSTVSYQVLVNGMPTEVI